MNKTMNNGVPQHIIDKLIGLGKKDNFDEPSISAEYEQFRTYEYLSRIHWREWHPVCENLPIDDHIALLKAVVMAMRYSGWDSGSVAPCHWVYGKLKDKIPQKVADDIASWMIEHSDNPWMPFGRQGERERFLANMAERQNIQ